ncbi:MAG TPA: hypothetical protein DEA96_15985 [Leptospiraceae bacterium]|nr:hypothetical protein [Spirochaetaceae bacterium]HBS06469.1 hypothetical protein [Leptospiraceae bacterium]|tara:strand:- start:10846 stop:11667 length:822 start_codon:yes stop_codon:yes gene_type:complete
MKSRTVRIAWFALAAFAAIALVRLAYNLVQYDPWKESFNTVERKADLDWKSREALSSGPEGFYSRSSIIWLAIPGKDFQQIHSKALNELQSGQGTILHQQQSDLEDTTYSVLHSVINEQMASALLESWKSSYRVLRFEENRKDRTSEFNSLSARLEALQQTRARITITPEQFKLSASREVSEEQASLQSRLQEFERARTLPPQQALTVVFLSQSGLGFASVAALFMDALWWSVALFGAITILVLFGFLVLRLFQGGKEFLGWLGTRLDPKQSS